MVRCDDDSEKIRLRKWAVWKDNDLIGIIYVSLMTSTFESIILRSEVVIGKFPHKFGRHKLF